jgi:2-dehydropantoate 2-reductase
MSLKILIVGAGAIGSLVGGKLAQSGANVTLVGRERFVSAVRQHGLRMRIGESTARVDNVRPAASIHEALWLAAEEKSSYDIAILTVKSYDSEEALVELAAASEANRTVIPAVLSLQNGVGNEEAIAARFGADKVIAGSITAPVEAPEPGLIYVKRPKFVVGLARWERNLDEQLFHQIGHELEAAGIGVTYYPSAQAMKWTKLLMNMMGNATSAILAQPPGQTFADPRIADLEIDGLREALSVMRAASIAPVNFGKYPLGMLAPFLRYAPKSLLRPVLRRIVGGARGGKMPSLYLDLAKGNVQNEILWYNGAVVRKGEEMGVVTPVNRVITHTLLQIAHNSTLWPQWQAKPDRLLTAVEMAAGHPY